MLAENNVQVLSLTFDQLIGFEARLMLLAFGVFLVCHIISFVCRMLGIRTNWIKSYFRSMMRNRKSTLPQ